MLVQSPGLKDPLEKEMAIRSSILAWEIPCTEEPGGLQSMGSQKSQTRLSDCTTNHCPATRRQECENTSQRQGFQELPQGDTVHFQSSWHTTQ